MSRLARCVCGHRFLSHWWHESIQWFNRYKACTRRNCPCQEYRPKSRRTAPSSTT